MEVKFPRSICSYQKPILREVRNQELTQEVKLTDGMPDVGEVLAAWGQILLRSKEWRSGELSVSGGVMAWVLYATENEEEVRRVETWIPFHMKWNAQDENREGEICLQGLVRFADARSVSARKLMLRLGIGMQAQAWIPMEESYAAPGEVPEYIQLRREIYPLRLMKEAGEKSFLIDDSFALPADQPRPEKLIAYTMQPEITEKKVVGNKVVFRGNGNLHTVFLSEEGLLHSWDATLPFSQFSELKAVYDGDAQAAVTPCVTSLELELDDESHFHLKAGLVGQYQVDDRQKLELVTDAYATRGCLEMDKEALSLPVLLEQRTHTLQAKSALRGTSGRMVEMSLLPDFPRERRQGEEVSWELPGQFRCLSYDDHQRLRGGTARWEGQLRLRSDAQSFVDAAVLPPRQLAAQPGAEQMELEAELPIRTDTWTMQQLPMVTALDWNAQEEPDPSRPSLILRRVGKDELWEIAKSTGSTVEGIRSANTLDEEPEESRILLIPVSG